MRKFLLLLAIVIFTFSYAHADLKVGSVCKFTDGGIGFKKIGEIVLFSQAMNGMPGQELGVKYMEELHNKGILGIVPEGTAVKILEIFIPSVPISKTAKSYVKVEDTTNDQGEDTTDDQGFWTFDVLLLCE